MSLFQNLRCLRSAWLISLLGIIAVLMLTACGGATTAPASPTTAPSSQPIPTTAASPATSSSMSTNLAQVKMVENNGQYSFSPTTVTIAKGGKVVWTNASDAPHTITPDTANAFTASSDLTEGQTYSLVFNTAGTYTYHCSIHSYMKATIIVQ